MECNFEARKRWACCLLAAGVVREAKDAIMGEGDLSSSLS